MSYTAKLRYLNNHIFFLLPLRSLFIRRILKEPYIFYLNKVLPLGFVKIQQMPLVIVNFLLEVDDLLSWIVDEVTAAVEKVGAKDVCLIYHFPNIGIQYNIIL